MIHYFSLAWAPTREAVLRYQRVDMLPIRLAVHFGTDVAKMESILRMAATVALWTLLTAMNVANG